MSIGAVSRYSGSYPYGTEAAEASAASGLPSSATLHAGSVRTAQRTPFSGDFTSTRATPLDENHMRLRTSLSRSSVHLSETKGAVSDF